MTLAVCPRTGSHHAASRSFRPTRHPPGSAPPNPIGWPAARRPRNRRPGRTPAACPRRCPSRRNRLARNRTTRSPPRRNHRTSVADPGGTARCCAAVATPAHCSIRGYTCGGDNGMVYTGRLHAFESTFEATCAPWAHTPSTRPRPIRRPAARSNGSGRPSRNGSAPAQPPPPSMNSTPCLTNSGISTTISDRTGR
jgi:hypothetical protein